MNIKLPEKTIFKIPVKLAFWHTLLAISLVIGGLSNYLHNKNKIRLEKYQEMQMISNFKYDQIAGWLNERRTEARLVRNNAQIQNLILELTDVPKKPLIIEEIREWLLPIYKTQQYSDIFIITENLKPHSLFSESTNFSGLDTVYQILRKIENDTIFTTDLLQSNQKNEVFILNIVPYFIKSSNKFSGAIIFKIEAKDKLYPILYASVLPMKTLETFLVSISPDSIRYMSPLRHKSIRPLKDAIPFSFPNLAISKFDSIKPLVVEGVNCNKEPVLSFTKQVASSNWHLVVEITQAEIFQPVTTRAIFTTIFILVLIIIAGFILIYYWKSREIKFLIKESGYKHEKDALIKHFNYLTKYANDIIILMNETGRIVWGNEKALQTYGYTEDEFTKLTIFDLKLPVNRIIVQAHLQALKEKGGMLYETEHLKKNGEIINVEISSKYIDVDGKSFYQGIIRDISERKRHEIELHESREKLAITLKSIGDAVITTDKAGLVTSANPVAEILTGWKESEAIGKQVNEVFKIRSAIDFKPVENPIKKVFETGLIIGLANHTELVARDGRIYQIADSAAPIKKNNGEIIGAVMVFSDVTEKYKKEKAIRENEIKFRTLFELAGDSFFIMDKDIVLDCNYRTVTMFGLASKNDIVGSSILRFSAEFQGEEIPSGILASQYIQAATEGKPQNFEWKHKKLNGELFDSDISLNTVSIQDKILIQASIRDISERKEAEKSIRQWGEIFNNAKTGIVIIHSNSGRLDLMNTAFAKMHGYTVEELKEQPINSIIAPGIQSNSLATTNIADETGHYITEQMHIKKNGLPFPVLLDVTAVKNAQGKMIYRIINVQDITERKKAEEEISLLFEISSFLNVTVDLQTSLEGIIKMLCKTCELDYGEAWLPHETKNYLVHSKIFYFSNKALSEFAEKSSRLTLNFGEGLPGQAWASEKLIWYKNIFKETEFTGKELALQYGLNSGISKRIMAGGKTIVVLAFFIRKLSEKDNRLIKLINSVASHFGEVLQRKWAEGEIRKLFVALEQSPVAVEITNPQGVIEYVNKKYIESTGYLPSEVIGREADFISLGQPSSQLFNDFKITLSKGQVWSGEVLNRKKNGDYFWEQVYISAIKDNAGKILHYISVKEDISQRKSLEQEMLLAQKLSEEASRLKSAILANMSHEIRTPLNGILGFSQILQQRISDIESINMAKMIEESGERLLNTLSGLVEIAQFETVTKVSQKNTELFNLVNKVCEPYLKIAAEKNLFMLNKIPEDTIIYTDAARLAQALKYLVDNALKFTKQGGVTFSCRKINIDNIPNYTISVADTGIGIAKENQVKLFDLFWQESQGYERTFEGTGIGLALVKKIITLLNGTITVESVPGKGSCFNLNLPIALQQIINEDLLPEEPLIRNIPIKGTKKQKVLIVEDNNINANLLKLQLQEWYETDLAPNGNSAIEKSRGKKFDIILMDINLGQGIDGVQTTKEIRKLPGYNETPIVAVTGYALPGDKEKFLTNGFNHFLPKPFTRDQLINLIGKL